AACGGLRSASDHRTRRVLLHLSYSCAPQITHTALVTHDPQRTSIAWSTRGARHCVMPWASSSICRTPIDHGSTAFRRTLLGVTRRERCGRSAILTCPTSIAWSRRAALGETAKLRYVTLLNVLGWQIKKNGTEGNDP